jgi:hypothetical protein
MGCAGAWGCCCCGGAWAPACVDSVKTAIAKIAADRPVVLCIDVLFL